MTLTLRNVALNLLYYGLTVVLFPWIVLWLDTYFGFVRQLSASIRGASVVVGLAGAGLQFWCIFLFQSYGRGTPSPALAPIRLVTIGPYKCVRNPMNIGELLVFLSISGWFASPSLFAYSAVAALAFHGFVVLWEEPHHLSLFGEEYVRYRIRVNRWLPSLARRARS